jgi:acetyl-CoA acetyltransferase
MREVAVIGIGCTKFGRDKRSIRDIGIEACLEAIKDANIRPKDIQCAYAGNLAQWEFGQGLYIGHLVLRELGITKIPITRVENGCATGSCAFREAWYKIATGACDLAIAFGVEQMNVVDSSVMLSGATGRQYAEREGDMGFTFPGLYGLMGRRHMEEFGTTREQFALVAVKNRRHGALNPLAQLPAPVTLEEVLNSKMVSDPVTAYQCCPRGDGAAAAILAGADVARKFTARPVWVSASVQVSGGYPDDKSFTYFDGDTRAAAQAYEMAGIGPEDLDLAEVHDCFTVAELIHYEDLGFCKKGEGGKFIEEGSADIGGKIAVSPSGGLLSKGHVIGATGVSQITEIVKQLRGEAGENQVPGAKVGLQHNGGGYTHTDNATAIIHILRR